MKYRMTGFTVFLFFLTSVTTLTAQNKDSIEGDFEALQDIYEVTGGDSWINNSGWTSMTPETMGDAYGVEVWEIGEHQGRVKVLFLFDNGLTNIQRDKNGSKNLDDRGRYQLIEGRGLKESLGNLNQMEYIDLRLNQLTGYIPDSFWLLSNLEVAALGFADQTRWGADDNDIRNLVNPYGMKSPYDGAQYYGNIPSTVENMTSLEYLFLERNYFDQTPIPKELFELPNLKWVALSHNGHIGNLPNIELPPNIDYINIRGGSFDRSTKEVNATNGPHYYLSGELPPLWGSSKSLETLQLHFNEFTGEIPSEWQNMSNIFNLILDHSGNITGGFPNFFNKINTPRLNTLYLSRLNLTGELNQNFSVADNNAVFIIGPGNNFSGELPDSFKSISHPDYPSRLILWGIQDQNFEGPFMDDMSGLNKLRALYGQNNNFSGSLPVDYPASSDLNTFYLSNNNFTGTIPATIGNMTTPYAIALNGNKLSSYEKGAISPVVIDSNGNYERGLRKLKSIGLHNNSLTQEDLDQIILDMWANVQSRKGSKYENWGTNAQLNISNQSTGAVPSYSSEVNAAILGLSANGWDAIYDGSEEDDRTVVLPDSPSLLFPSDQSSDLSLTPTFEWENTGAALYRIEILESSSNEQILVIDQERAVYTHETELKENKEYKWRVRAIENGLHSDWSKTRTFKTVAANNSNEARVFPSSPMPMGPADESNNISVTPEFRWSAVEGADYYTLHMSRNSPSGMVIDVSVDDTVYTHPEKLGDNSTHHWRVRAVKDGEPGEWSDVFELQTEETSQPDMADLVAPEHFAQNISVTPQLEWDLVEADIFEIRILDKSTEDIVLSDETAANTYTPGAPLTEETAYIWQVKNIKDGVQGAWSPRWEFTTGLYDYTVDSPYLVAPNKGAEYESLTPTFKWQSVGAEKYVISVTTENPSNAKVLSGSAEETTVILKEVPETKYISEETLEPKKIYFWRVKAIDSGVEGDWSETWEFMTPENQTTVSISPGEDPLTTDLKQNYPNPFNPSTQINYTLANLQDVSLRVYDLTGRQVAILADGLKQAGQHTATFNASNLASGVYIYRLISETHQFTKKMTLLK